MPERPCTQDGKPGVKWGESGTCYTYTPNDPASLAAARRQMSKQTAAIESGKRSDAMRMPSRYKGIDFTPPKAAQEEAKRALQWLDDGEKFGTDSGRLSARLLASGSPFPWNRMPKLWTYLISHAEDEKAQGWRPGEPGYPSNGRGSYALWGGKPALPWALRVKRQMEAADKKAGVS